MEWNLNTESKYHQLKLCGGADRCPMTVLEDKRVASILLEELTEAKLTDYIAVGLNGKPVLSHHKFKMAVSGCPNGCSEPHIKDLAIIGQQKPLFSDNMQCTGCGVCLPVCKEGALDLKSRTLVINYDKCLGCGRCITACSKNVLVPQQSYKVIVGGRLGRHPRLAETLAEVENLDQLRAVVANCLKLYKTAGRENERFSHLVERTGLDFFLT